MQIPKSYVDILDKNIELFEDETSSKVFIDACFSDLFSRSKTLSFQTRAKISGDMFEFIFYYLLSRKFNLELDAEIQIKKACMEGVGALDFGIVNKDGKILCGIEAKGSAEVVNGKILSRPALKRTDTMKKAIAQAYQFKRIFPSTPFYIVTNVKPKNGNARCMMDLAEGDIIDKVYDITDPKELKELVANLKNFRQQS